MALSLSQPLVYVIYIMRVSIGTGGYGEIGGDPGNWGELAPTPEPGTAVLWLTGIVLMILRRKRIAQTLRLDTGTNLSLSRH